MINRVLVYIFFIFLSTSFPEKNIEVGIDEKLGNFIPKNSYFFDLENNKVYLKDIITKPTVLAFVYYNCPGICNPLLLSLAEVIDKSDLVLGVDYNVIVISMNEQETNADAIKMKNKIYEIMEKNPPPTSWYFLTGNLEEIKKLTDAVGFYFKREGNDFRHAGTIIFLDRYGKITRYLFPGYSIKHGFDILPFDFKMAIIEASESKVIPTIARVLQFCYSYDPAGRSYVFNFTKIFGIIIIVLIAVFLIYLKSKHKKLDNIH